MISSSLRLTSIFMCFFLHACASFNPVFEEPDISVSAFRLLPSNGLPEFEIELKVTNPNSMELKLQGISYSASLDGYKVVSGVASNIQAIPAYGTGTVTLTGGLDLFSGLQFLADIMQRPNKGINYQLQAKLDFGRFIPNMHVDKSGIVMAPRN